MFSLIPNGRSVGVGFVGAGGDIFLKKFFLYVILKLCTKFQYPTMPAAGQKVCGGGVVVVWSGGWLKPILVFSLAQAEHTQTKHSFD